MGHVGPRNEHKEGGHRGEVDRPGGLMRGPQARLRASAEQQADGIANDREGRPRRLLDRQPQRLHDQAAQQDEGEQRQRRVEAPVDVQPRRALDITPIDGQPQADQPEQPGQIQRHLVGQIEVALEQLGAEQQLEDVGVDRGEGRADEEQRHGPEDHQVHRGRIALAEDAELHDGVDEDPAQARQRPVRDDLRLAAAPEPVAPGEAPGHDEHGEADGHEHEHPEEDGDVVVADAPGDVLHVTLLLCEAARVGVAARSSLLRGRSGGDGWRVTPAPRPWPPRGARPRAWR